MSDAASDHVLEDDAVSEPADTTETTHQPPPPRTPTAPPVSPEAPSIAPPSYSAAVFSPPGWAPDSDVEKAPLPNDQPTTSGSYSRSAWHDVENEKQTIEQASCSGSAPIVATRATTARPAAVLLRSQVSVCSSSTSQSSDICRICHCEASIETPLITPCYCAGSLKYVHQHCLQQWIKSSQTKSCEVCRYLFIMESKMKPFNKWEKLDISPIERRKLLCSVAFHMIALLCVTWSLYILILQNISEIQKQNFEWAFWTKLVVVAVGFTGAAVFMYVQCRMYIHLCKRWKAYNKVIYVQNCPERQPSKNPPVSFEATGRKGRTAANTSRPATAVVVNCST